MEEPIKIREIKEIISELYNPEDKFLGIINSDKQLNDIRIQIAEKGLNGYYIKWRDNKIFIYKDGNLSSWPYGFYDLMGNQLITLISING